MIFYMDFKKEKKKKKNIKILSDGWFGSVPVGPRWALTLRRSMETLIGPSLSKFA
jgi:hypothetical protein